MRPLLLALVLCLAAAPAGAATYSSLAADDGHVSGPKDGAYTTLDTELFVALTLYGSWTTMRESLFEYDISSIPAGATLTGATWQIQTSSENGVFQVNGYVADGVLELADAPAPEDSVGVFYGGTFGIRQVPLDLARIQALVDAGSGYLGLAVRGEPDTTSSVQISTKEISSAEARAARLILDYQEPTDAPPAGRFALEGAAPNPFNPATVLRYTLDAEGPVRLRLYDTRGRKVTTLVERIQPAGEHRVRWNGADDAGRSLPSGVYLAVLSDGAGRRSVGKLVLAR